MMSVRVAYVIGVSPPGWPGARQRRRSLGRRTGAFAGGHGRATLAGLVCAGWAGDAAGVPSGAAQSGPLDTAARWARWTPPGAAHEMRQGIGWLGVNKPAPHKLSGLERDDGQVADLASQIWLVVVAAVNGRLLLRSR